MPNLLKKGASMLTSAMAASASDRLEYHRGTAVIAIDATRGKNTADSVNDDGFMIKVRFDDFLVPTDQLKLSGDRIEPVAGDYIIDRTGSTPIKFEVCNTPTEPCWRYSDPNHLRIRIHTRQVPYTNA